MLLLPDPPSDLAALVGGDMGIGRAHVSKLQRFSGLRPDDRVLDVGSGIGRTASWLVPVLTEGSYEGFDIHAESVAWCQNEIAPRHPNFRFQHVDLANAAYNPTGTLAADAFTFPYPDEDFDIVCLFSVFTHLMPDDLDHYLSEIRRVLRPDGRIHASFFLLDDERLKSLGASSHPVARSLMASPGPARTGFETAEWMVAYEETFVRSRLAAHGFRLHLTFYGRWPELDPGDVTGPQDIVIAYRY